jgi:hypothetical protein
MATSGVFRETVIWPSATVFLMALIFTLISLLGVECHGLGRRGLGLTLCLTGSFLAPMSFMIGLPCGLCTLLYGFLRLRLGRHRTWADSLKPGLFGMVGTVGLISLYLALDRGAFATDYFGHERGSILTQMRPVDGLALALRSLTQRQWAQLLLPVGWTGYAFSGLAGLCLFLFRRYYEKKFLVAFIGWSFGFLLFTHVFRAWAGEGILDWTRYQLFPAIGTAGLFALAVEGVARAPLGSSLQRRRWARRTFPILLILILSANALITAGQVHKTAQTRKRYVGQFCQEWARFPEDYYRYSGRKVIPLPDVQLDIMKLVPTYQLSYYEFCWPRQHEWTVKWVSPRERFDKDIVDYLTYHSNLGGVRHWLRHSLYPD